MTADPLRTEQVKLTATYVNNLATAIFAIGGLTPIFTALSASGPSLVPRSVIGAISLVRCLASAALHWSARRYLREMMRP
ncbi:hypothetical protein [Methylobacterium iners]|uniref:Amino acid transporter n=1 Tax=Methylobacterium iners TaxID=418707 RepID=A0ABQ4S171_9HYPH|nr:hypothetical protein [Methylobacterium iners]GJD96178.1 hypothetical protein OCOJLMKI_3397 [Methylobacterium iners]